MMEKHKILLDTDIGDDIDDALALALALEMPEMELVGVTTVFQNTEKRARLPEKCFCCGDGTFPFMRV